MRPNYGTPDHLFETKSFWDVSATELERELIAEIPQATFSVVVQPSDDGELLIEVNWAVEGYDDLEPISLSFR